MNNKGTDQTACMRRLVCAVVVHKPPKTGFLAYFDVIEEVDAIIDKSGTTVTAEIQGYVSWFICFTPPDKSAYFLFLNQNKCCGYSKEPSQMVLLSTQNTCLN